MTNIDLYDFIELNDLEIPLCIGIHSYEKKMQQKLKLHIKIYCDFTQISDDIGSTIDYSIIKPELIAAINDASFALIETFANFTANWINKRFNAFATEVIVKKFHVIDKVNYVAVRALRFSDS